MANLNILVVDDDELVLRGLSRVVNNLQCAAFTATSMCEARVLLCKDIDAMIVDIGLPDGTGFELIEASPHIPTLVLTGSNAREDINRAQILGAEYCCKPADTESISRFVERIFVRRAMWLRIRTIGSECHLTPTHIRILKAAVESASHDALLRELNITRNTLKTHIRAILMRTGDVSLEELAARIRSDVFRLGLAYRSLRLQNTIPDKRR